jgi:hypothetical protein
MLLEFWEIITTMDELSWYLNFLLVIYVSFIV